LIARNFLRDGLSVEAVARGTGLSIGEVQQLQQQLNEPAQSQGWSVCRSIVVKTRHNNPNAADEQSLRASFLAYSSPMIGNVRGSRSTKTNGKASKHDRNH
jgi:hypothetical protein